MASPENIDVDSPPEESQQTETQRPTDRTTGILFRAVDSLLNLDLLREAKDELEIIDWYRLAFTSFYIGLIGLMLWIVYVIFVLALSYVLSSGGVIEGGGRVMNVGPLAPAAIFLVILMTSKYFKRLRSGVWGDDTNSEAWSGGYRLLLISLSALIMAVALRGAIYQAASTVLGNNPYSAMLIGFVLLDLGYVSMILIGIGGLVAYFLSPK